MSKNAHAQKEASENIHADDDASQKEQGEKRAEAANDDAANDDGASFPAGEPLDAIEADSPEAKERSHGRKHERVNLEVSVTLNGEDTFYTGITENISEGGVFVFTSCPWPLNTKVDLSLFIGDDVPFFLSTTIRWIREDDGSELPAGMGLQFDDLSREDEKKVKDFLKKNGKDTEFYDL
ncbi:MAG: PilZ domain-containing protein [Deltaproteobacteria bacterium]|nr:PilZ domain-containing protein [Deltaproteobacteria bacterium]